MTDDDATPFLDDALPDLDDVAEVEPDTDPKSHDDEEIE